MIGETLGHYSVESELGAGGMGRVYLATDTRLHRRVAIKVLHTASLEDQDRLMRFEREARLLASLNHANIAAIHGLEQAGDLKFLVLEYVPGRTLAERIASGPLTLKAALDVARQVAEALDAAHQRGVIHRDLKPANVKITPDGQVKVLDFGLAKALAANETDSDIDARTTAPNLTHIGVVMGTVGYMSPEQATGKVVDTRTDIWALGCMLYEMLAGVRTFGGDSTTEVLVQLLERDPNWSALPATTPANVCQLLRRCLTKDARRRLHHAGDVRLELEDTLAERVSGAVAVSPRRRTLTPAIAGIAAGAVLGAVVGGTWIWQRAAPETAPRIIRLAIDLPENAPLRPGYRVDLAFSRDSRTLLYPVAGALHARRLDESDASVVQAAAGLRWPFFSPDDRWLLMADPVKNNLVKVPLNGGAPIPIAPVDMPFGGDWASDGYVYVTNQLIGGIIRTRDEGGGVEPVTEIDAERLERSHRYGTLLPGDKALMFTVASGSIDSYDDARIDIVDLSTKKRKTVVQGGTYARYSPSGHIVYAREGRLYAIAFDHRTLETSGTPVKVLDGVLMSTNIGTAYFDISRSGDLAYAAGPPENGGRTFHWVDRQGNSTPLPLPPRSYLNPRISPDGKQLATEIEGPNHDFYVYDFDRDVMSRITNDGSSHAPIWTPDARRIAYRTWKGGAMTMSWLPADRSGPEERLVNYTAWQSATSFSPDGKYLAFDQYDRTSPLGGDIWILPLEGDRQPRPFVKTGFPEGAAKFSPDGQWVAYSSMESGRPEIYVQAWPGPGAKIQISSDGGTDPLWRRDGKEIFYRNGPRMMAVTATAGSTFRAGKPQMLWSGEYTHGLSSSCGWQGTSRTSYDVSLDGERFLMIKDDDQSLFATKIMVVVNWAAELNRIMAGSGAARNGSR
jgi:tRNA A-37 threonylcarbamoyl transferase component Bud32